MTHEEREQALSEEDYIELRHRFGTVVESVVRDKQAQAENKCNPNDCPHPYGTYETCNECKANGDNVFKMRDATPEERESINKYIKSISKPTGIEFDEEQEQIDFVQPKKTIPCTIKTQTDRKQIYRKSAELRSCENLYEFVKLTQGMTQELEQEPSGDCIRRADVLDLIEDMTDQFGVRHRVITKKVIELLPSVKLQSCEDAVSRQAVKEQMIKYGFHAPDMTVTEFVEDLTPVKPQDCDSCEVGNPCLYCKHEFEPQKVRMKTMEDRAISLNAVLDALEMSYLKSEIDDLTYQRIKELPPVTPKTGHWIVDRSLIPFTYTCDICNMNVFFDDYVYCPNCGAKMSEIPTGSESEVNNG